MRANPLDRQTVSLDVSDVRRQARTVTPVPGEAEQQWQDQAGVQPINEDENVSCWQTAETMYNFIILDISSK